MCVPKTEVVVGQDGLLGGGGLSFKDVGIPVAGGRGSRKGSGVQAGSPGLRAGVRGPTVASPLSRRGVAPGSSSLIRPHGQLCGSFSGCPGFPDWEAGSLRLRPLLRVTGWEVGLDGRQGVSAHCCFAWSCAVLPVSPFTGEATEEPPDVRVGQQGVDATSA